MPINILIHLAVESRFCPMQFGKAEKFITSLLQSDLSPLLYYHNYFHTMDVLGAAVQLAKEENISDKDDLALLKTAALYHDCGFVHVYHDHEEEGCRLAKETLPSFGYTENQIEIICNMIMKTKLPSEPETHLEKILCDADLDYLGRDDFERIGKKLFMERSVRGKVHDEKEWDGVQIKFLEEHYYYTQSAKLKRENKKQEHLDKLREKVK